MTSRIKDLADCFEVDKKIKEMLKQESLSEGERKILDEIYEEISGLPKIIDIYGFTSTETLDMYKCKSVRDNIAFEIRTLADNVFGIQPNKEPDKTFKSFVSGLALAIEKGYIPVAVQKQVLNGLIMQKHLIAGLHNYYATQRQNTNALVSEIERVKSMVDYNASNILTSRSNNEWFMYKMQSIILFLMLGLFPVVIALAFLPAFGYNFRLLLSYTLSYYLVKLWIPVYLIAYEFFTGKMFATISGLFAFIMPDTAFAGALNDTTHTTALEVYTALVTSIPETTAYTNQLMNALAMAIPTTLGGGALILIGRDFYHATHKSMLESMASFHMAGFMLSRGLSALGGLGKGGSSGSSVSESVSGGGSGAGSGGAVVMTESLKAGGGTITREFIKDEKTGLLLSSGNESYNLISNSQTRLQNSGLVTSREEVLKEMNRLKIML